MLVVVTSICMVCFNCNDNHVIDHAILQNSLQGDLFVAELPTRQFVCDLTLYRVICLQLNSLQGDLFVVELSTG